MIQLTAWPPPDWHEVVITWEQILADKNLKPAMLYEWCEQRPGGRFHVHGWQSTEGFAFRFERAKDATIFALVWA
jgi:hypothetical protein